jgi:Ca2+-binding EF-hand superfamily protein
MNPKLILLAPLFMILPMCANSKSHREKRSTEELEAAFQRKDTNHDGYLSKEEFFSSSKDPKKAARIFEKRDRNWDGRLSEQEYLTHITKPLT